MNNSELKQLVEARVITEETAERIRTYFKERNGNSSRTLFSVLVILASLLVGLGLILIIAHNWDEFARGLKVVLAFIPLVTAQALCLYTLLSRKLADPGWREGSSISLFLSLGACIALISQIYHIQGDLDTFLMSWMLLCAPVIYLMRSSMVSVLYLVGITWYALISRSGSVTDRQELWYWPMFLLAMPHYYFLIRKRPESNLSLYHNWAVTLSLTLALGTLSSRIPELMYPAYMSLFAIFYLIGHRISGVYQNWRNNPSLLMGSLGTVGLLLFLSFEEFWAKLVRKDFPADRLLSSPELVAVLVLTCIAGLVFYQNKRRHVGSLKPLNLVFAAFVMVFLVGVHSTLAVVLINVMVFLVGMMTIREGARSDDLGVLNYGLLIVSALTACRFFDTDLSFVLRGVLFITVGVAIFILNTWMLRRRT